METNHASNNHQSSESTRRSIKSTNKSTKSVKLAKEPIVSPDLVFIFEKAEPFLGLLQQGLEAAVCEAQAQANASAARYNRQGKVEELLGSLAAEVFRAKSPDELELLAYKEKQLKSLLTF